LKAPVSSEKFRGAGAFDFGSKPSGSSGVVSDVAFWPAFTANAAGVFAQPAAQVGPIPFGDAASGTMQGPRYTRYAKLQQAKKVAGLF
jgi:hypothetical protein